MKRIAWIVACAAVAASAYAQQTYEPTVPRGLSDSRVAPSGTLAPPVQPQAPSAVVVDPAVPQLAMNVRRHQRDADARQCLQLATNLQIHRCAERYRSRASRAQVSKASLQKQATRSAESTVIVRETTVVTTKTGPGKAVETPKPSAGAKPAAATSAAPAVAAAPRPDSKTTVTTQQPVPKAVDPVKTTK